MNGFVMFARKEVREILRTWRIWVLPGILLFFALSGPVLARFTPEIVGSLAGDQLGGFVMPDPTFLDSYAQWVGNLAEIGLFALIIIYGGIVSAERKSGTAVLVLTKPVSRSAFVIAKAAVHSVFLAVLVMIGTLLTWGGTALIFGEAPARPLWSSAMVWLAFGVLFIAIMVLLSVQLRSQAGAAGSGLGVYVLISIAALWEPIAKYTPAGLTDRALLLAADKDAVVLWPVLTSVALTVALVAIAALAFRRQEI